LVGWLVGWLGTRSSYAVIGDWFGDWLYEHFEAYVPDPDRGRPDTAHDAVYRRSSAGLSLDLKVGSQREAGVAWPLCVVVPVRFDQLKEGGSEEETCREVDGSERLDFDNNGLFVGSTNKLRAALHLNGGCRRLTPT
jgi:hypothetical protein